ncbi:MAG: ribbon-helix-helix protein, CopG family [Candidatus Rokuibacteriota bacterium]
MTGTEDDEGKRQRRKRAPSGAVRKSFVLSEDEAEALRGASLRSGRSVPELIREAIRRFLGLREDDQP